MRERWTDRRWNEAEQWERLGAWKVRDGEHKIMEGQREIQKRDTGEWEQKVCQSVRERAWESVYSAVRWDLCCPWGEVLRGGRTVSHSLLATCTITSRAAIKCGGFKEAVCSFDFNSSHGRFAVFQFPFSNWSFWKKCILVSVWYKVKISKALRTYNVAITAIQISACWCGTQDLC